MFEIKIHFKRRRFFSYVPLRKILMYVDYVSGYYLYLRKPFATYYLLISQSSCLPLVLFATIEIDDFIAPSTLLSSFLEILQRALKNIIIIKTKSQHLP